MFMAFGSSSRVALTKENVCKNRRSGAIAFERISELNAIEILLIFIQLLSILVSNSGTRSRSTSERAIENLLNFVQLRSHLGFQSSNLAIQIVYLGLQSSNFLIRRSFV